MKQVNNFVKKNQLLRLALKNKLQLVTSVEGRTKLSDKTIVETYKSGSKYYHLILCDDNITRQPQFRFCVENNRSSFHLSEVDIIFSSSAYDMKKLSDCFRYTYDTVTYDRKFYYYGC